LAQLLVEFPKATVALEAGTHSPWISRYLTEQGATVLVAKEREKRAPSPASWTRSSKESSRLRGNTEQPTTNIQHSTFNVQHSTFNVQHSTFNIQHSTFNVQRSTFKATDALASLDVQC